VTAGCRLPRFLASICLLASLFFLLLAAACLSACHYFSAHSHCSVSQNGACRVHTSCLPALHPFRFLFFSFLGRKNGKFTLAINASGLLAGLDRTGPSAAHPLASPRAEDEIIIFPSLSKQTIQCANALPRNNNAGPRSAAAVGRSSMDNGHNFARQQGLKFHRFQKKKELESYSRQYGMDNINLFLHQTRASLLLHPPCLMKLVITRWLL